MSKKRISDILEFLLVIGQTKRTLRSGWIHSHVYDNVETISSHMYRMTLMTLTLDNPKGIDMTKCMKMAVVHDLAECLTGDLIPADHIKKEEKHRREFKSFQDIISLIPNEDIRINIFDIWQEYENQSTAEAKYVKELDVMDMIVQAFEYEQIDKQISLEHFFKNTENKIKSENLKEIDDEIRSFRQHDNVENRSLKNLSNLIVDSNQFSVGSRNWKLSLKKEENLSDTQKARYGDDG
ncbi:hypothetical protein SNEBB_007632 [Seison nebaliae]|nr:hypothetical protein SNEBB_007632 [Seison nebaliae]